IKTAADLKGKVIGGDRPGTSGDYSVRQFLAQLQLQRGDVTVRELGGSDVAYPALTSNQIDAAPLIPPTTFQAEDKGYHVLADLYSAPNLSIAAIVSKARLAELGPRLKSYLMAYRQGILAFGQQRDVTLKVLRDYTKEADDAILTRTYDFFVKSTPFETSLRPDPAGIQSMLDFFADTGMPQAKNSKAAQFVDTSLLDQLAF
ncbi:MAG: ABC transporter substrate-binding protein, partial [Chloroflexi bacterium]|nr:ABC transporter substrate-binding protein [Chloroflexota bacterium]